MLSFFKSYTKKRFFPECILMSSMTPTDPLMPFCLIHLFALSAFILSFLNAISLSSVDRLSSCVSETLSLFLSTAENIQVMDKSNSSTIIKILVTAICILATQNVQLFLCRYQCQSLKISQRLSPRQNRIRVQSSPCCSCLLSSC